MDMDSNTAPGPDGLSVGFYKAFWPDLRDIFVEMFHAFHRGRLNLSRLNFGMSR
jgi:hypothetical protein